MRKPPVRGGSAPSKGAPSGEAPWIWGLHSIEACLQNHPESVLEVVCESDVAADVREQARALVKEAGLRMSEGGRLPGFLKEKRTQGIAARLREFPQTDYRDFEENFIEALASNTPGQWVLLDSLQDPRNYGAVLRSAAAFGVKAVITGKRDQCPITGVVAQASAGNVFRVENVVAQNLSRVLERVKKETAARVLALDGKGRDLPQVMKDVGHQPLVWVLGSEGEGLRPGLLNWVSDVVRIPMEAGVESLNASVAASLAFYSGYNR